jgi:hypothetical protein
MRFIAPYSLIVGRSIPLHLHGDHLADLRGSGLTDDTIAAAGVYSLRPCDLKLFFPGAEVFPLRLRRRLLFPIRVESLRASNCFPPSTK